MTSSSSTAEYFMYVGTYTNELSKGIYVFRFNTETGDATPQGLAAAISNPSFLALHPNGRFLYSVSENDESGIVASFAIDRSTGILNKLNEVSSKGRGPCHLNVDPSGRMLIVANYHSGNIASFPVNDDGSLGEATSFFQHEGNSIHERQKEPHAHSSDFSLDNRFAFFSDLGLDQVKVYQSDPVTAVLAPNEPAFASVTPGSGPRHFVQHPSGNFAYGINELSSTVSAFSYDTETGELSEIQVLSTLPEDYESENSTAEIALHPSGRFLYGSNRGHDSIAAYKINQQSGHLTLLELEPTQGEWPRNFAIDPSGKFLLAANQNSDNIVLFRIDSDSGLLTSMDNQFEVDAPVCVTFAKTISDE